MKNEDTESATLTSRRSALKTSTLLLGYVMTAGTTAAIMNGCKADRSDGWKPNYMTQDQNDLFAEVAEMIIPATDIPGAKGALVERWADEMLSTYSPEDRAQFIEGMRMFDIYAQEFSAKTFLESNEDERKSVLDRMVAESKKSDEPHIFNIVKEATVAGYCTSEVGAIQLLNYDPVPGPYKGCVDFSTLGATSAL